MDKEEILKEVERLLDKNEDENNEVFTITIEKRTNGKAIVHNNTSRIIESKK